MLRNRINLKINKYLVYKNKNGGKVIEDEGVLTEVEDEGKGHDVEDTITFSHFKQK